MIIREATPTDAPGIARVHVDSWRTTYRGLVPDDYLAKLSYADKQGMWDRILITPNYRGFVYVAEAEGGQVVGFVAGGPIRSEAEEGYAGEIYSIYILEAHQGKGIGRKLIQALVKRTREVDIHSMLVWVLADNSAEQFYAALGGQKLRIQQFEMDGMLLYEIGYGWEDTSSIVGNDKDTV